MIWNHQIQIVLILYQYGEERPPYQHQKLSKNDVHLKIGKPSVRRIVSDIINNKDSYFSAECGFDSTFFLLFLKGEKR